MSILNFGSLNIDHVYKVPHFVRAGESLVSLDYLKNLGGKGFNQSVALRRACANVYHAGCVGADGALLIDYLVNEGVSAEFTRAIDVPTGHAIIQVDAVSGDNCIFTYGGANQAISRAQVEATLANFGAGDIMLTQNEINGVGDIITAAKARGVRVAFNPSPFTRDIRQMRLSDIDILILNEVEGEDLTGETEPNNMLAALKRECPRALIVLTLGGDGSLCASEEGIIAQSAYKVTARDTTAAGDTFTGYFLAAWERGEGVKRALQIASKAAAISVTRQGAAQSIPKIDEIIP